MFLVLVAGAGCRESGADPVDATLPPPRLVFALDDSLRLDLTSLDDFGGTLSGSLKKIVWRVADVDGVYGGESGVTSLVETVIPPGAPDTLRFRFLPNGDIEQYGFFARVAHRRHESPLPSRWDRIGAFSLPLNGAWAAGVLDSAGTTSVQGKVVDNGEYYSATVNGVETVFRCSSVLLLGLDFEFLLTVSGSPASIVRYREETSSRVSGQQRALTSVRLRQTTP